MGALRQLVVQSLVAIATFVTAPAFCCAEVIYQTGFEQPTFMPGLLEGQDEWRSLVDGIDAAMITDVQPATGMQSLQIDGAALESRFAGLIGSIFQWPVNFDPVVNNLPIINIRADVRLDGPSTDAGAGFADDLVSANLTARTGRALIIADMLMSSSEEVWAGRSLLEAPIGLGQYYNLGLRLDYGNQEFEFFVNGNSLGVEPFLDFMPEPVLSTVSLELLAQDTVDPGQYTAYFDNLIITVGDEFPPQIGVLQPGDANQDRSFDQLDLVQVLAGGKYQTGEPATWGQGDWDGAPGGEPGNPPTGDGMFNQLDIITALGGGAYLTGPYAAVVPNGLANDGQASIVYMAGSDEVRVDAPAAVELTSIDIESASGIIPVPEPPTVVLLGLAAATFVGTNRSRSSNRSLNSTFPNSKAPDRFPGLDRVL